MRWIQQVQARMTRTGLVRFSLYSLTFIDEIVSTIPVLALPLIRTEMALDYAQVGWLLGIGGLSAWLVEPSLYAASDHWPKRRILMLALLGMIAALALAGSSPTFAILLVAFLLMGATNGPLLGMGQSFLIDTNLGQSLRTMTRWTFMAALGDLAGPALIAAAFALGMGWRDLFWAGALIWLALLVVLAVQRLPAAMIAAENDEPFSWRLVRDDLALALRTPQLIQWLLLLLLPSFLDEMFLAFAGLFLQERLAMTPTAISVALGVHVVGGLMGLVLLERIGQRFPPQWLLGWLALLVLAGLLLLVLSPTPLLAMVALWITGVGVSGWYPIASAEAFRALPGRSGTVRALSSLTTPIEVIVPLLIGLAAERWGIQVGVALLMLAPLAVLLLRPRDNQVAPVVE
jgi:predicted MFS family arabinose efflux permease